MRVLNPGPGEVVDRLTVVARKITERPSEAFVKEYFELFQELKKWGSAPFEYNLWFDLAATNAAIWQREDELRASRLKGAVSSVGQLSELAFKIQELNDSRSQLVKKINSAAGVEREEKL